MSKLARANFSEVTSGYGTAGMLWDTSVSAPHCWHTDVGDVWQIELMLRMQWVIRTAMSSASGCGPTDDPHD